MTPYKRIFMTSALLLTSVSPALAQETSSGLQTLISEGEVFGEVRYRYETVDQAGFTRDADAHTVRTNLGFKTGEYANFQALIEGQLVRSIGGEDFNSTTNNKGTFPIVADPDAEEVNQIWVSWSGLPQTRAVVGRQKINLDNQRFVGAVNWRQNDQTFDAIQVTNSSIENLDLFYSYIGNVNRIQGDDHPFGDLDTKTHLANVSYTFADWLKVAGYGYWMDFETTAANSNRTFGVRATGMTPINENWMLKYEAEFATQEDHANNTTNYDENYYHIAPSVSGHGFTFTAGYEKLGGNGVGSFRTPLATAHKFNGWADLFLTTPAAGLEDAYFGASYKVSGTESPLDGVKLGAVYHDYDSDTSTVGDFGDELNLSLGKTFDISNMGTPLKKLGVVVKYADYDGQTAAGADADRQKFWLQFGVKF